MAHRHGRTLNDEPAATARAWLKERLHTFVLFRAPLHRLKLVSLDGFRLEIRT